MRKFDFIAIAILALGLIVPLLMSPSASAITGWKAGRIINDSVFTAHTSMSTTQIQTFLNGKVPSCDTNGQKLSENGGPDLNGDGKVQRWEWGKAKYNQTKFICLKDYTVDGKKASQIIYEKAQKYKISPKVLLVLLQKEQSLVSDTWPLNLQYRSATGYGCPDTAPCASQYYGLVNQLDWAAKMFRAIMNDSPDWYTPYNVGNNYIQYNPQSSCGGSTVFIENRSTQALYNYTPYQPNKAALNAGWGSATCGAYGNRNFFLYFSSWFGRPNGNPYSILDEPRWMRLGAQATKYDLVTDTPVDSAFPAGTQFSFRDKIEINGVVYLRTTHDSTHGYQKGIRLTDVEEIPYVSLSTPRKFALRSAVNKHAPHSGKELTDQNLPSDLTPKFTTKTTVNGKVYFRTENDTLKNIRRGVQAAATTEVPFVTFKQPRTMRVSANTTRVNPILSTSETLVASGTEVSFDRKVWVDSVCYYQSANDTAANNQWVLPASSVEDILYERMPVAAMRLTTATAKLSPATGITETSQLEVGTRLRFDQQITVGGITHYRSQYDSSRRLDKAIATQYLEPIPAVTYTPIAPMKMKLGSSQRKLDATLLSPLGTAIKAGTALTFTSRTIIDGTTYYRTAYDTSHARQKVIPASQLATL